MRTENFFWGSIVLGMHDALVSTLGLIAGLVFANAGRYVIILTGIIACVAAALSMAASEYLAQKANGNIGDALPRGLATGATYISTAVLLLLPFVFIGNTFIAMGMMYVVAVSVIWFFNFLKYRLSNVPFWPRFLEMLGICFIVTASAFIIGECARICFGIQI